MTFDFKKMIEYILTQKSELTAEDIRDMIDEKKRKVGAGYLTDQGALFLVAADLGISFDSSQRLETLVKDLFVGAKDVNIILRIFIIYPIRKFIKKETNEEFQNRTLIAYDKTSFVRVKLWDNHVNYPDEIGLRPGDLIKISSGYVKSGLDNKLILNLGSKGDINILDNDDYDIPPIESKKINIDDINSEMDYITIEGIIEDNPRITSFTNNRNELTKSLQMHITNENNSKSIRSVLWNINELQLPKVLKAGISVKLIGVRVKQGNPQYGNNELEIHGDEGTLIITDEINEPDILVLKIISRGGYSSLTNKIECLCIDKTGSILLLELDNDMDTDDLVNNSVIECIPSKILGNTILLTKNESYVRQSDEQSSSFPSIEDLQTKINEVKLSDHPFIIEAIILQMPSTNEVNTKTGEVVSVSDTIVGDDTGEIRLVGWREQSSLLSQLNVGERIKIIGAVANIGREGKFEISLKSFSSIEKVG